MKINLEKAKKDHAVLLKKANNSLKKKDYNLMLSLVSCIANQAYHLNYCYTDRDLEDLLAKVSSELLEKSELKPEKSKYVFYDDFGYDNRGLTQQYLHALDELNIQYIYLVDSVGFNKEGSIGRQVSANPNAKIIEVPQKFNHVEKLQFI